jgi:hypothetical protein
LGALERVTRGEDTLISFLLVWPFLALPFEIVVVGASVEELAFGVHSTPSRRRDGLSVISRD